MRDRIEQYLNSVFQNTGISMTERAERMSEMRGHIDSLAQERREEGACISCCIRDAIEEFGDARFLRRRFSREQWRRDFCDAFRWSTRHVWLPILAGLFVSSPIWLTSTAALSALSGISLCLIATLLVFCIMLTTRIAAARICRPQPAAEVGTTASFVRWTAFAACMFTGVALGSALIAAITLGASGVAPAATFLRQIPTAVDENLPRLTAIALSTSILLAAGMTYQQRRSCITGQE